MFHPSCQTSELSSNHCGRIDQFFCEKLFIILFVNWTVSPTQTVLNKSLGSYNLTPRETEYLLGRVGIKNSFFFSWRFRYFRSKEINEWKITTFKLSFLNPKSPSIFLDRPYKKDNLIGGLKSFVHIFSGHSTWGFIR